MLSLYKRRNEMRSSLKVGIYQQTDLPSKARGLFDWGMIKKELAEIFPDKRVYLAYTTDVAKVNWRVDDSVRIVIGTLSDNSGNVRKVDSLSLGKSKIIFSKPLTICQRSGMVGGEDDPLAWIQTIGLTICIGLRPIEDVTCMFSDSSTPLSMTQVLLAAIRYGAASLKEILTESDIQYVSLLNSAFLPMSSSVICPVVGNEHFIQEETRKLGKTNLRVGNIDNTPVTIGPITKLEDIEERVAELDKLEGFRLKDCMWAVLTPTHLLTVDGDGKATIVTALGEMPLYGKIIKAAEDTATRTKNEAEMRAKDLISTANATAKEIIATVKAGNVIYPPLGSFDGSYTEGLVNMGNDIFHITFPVVWEYKFILWNRGEKLEQLSVAEAARKIFPDSPTIPPNVALAKVAVKWGGGKTCDITEIYIYSLARGEVTRFAGYHIYKDSYRMCFPKNSSIGVPMRMPNIYSFVSGLLETINRSSLTTAKGHSLKINAILSNSNWLTLDGLLATSATKSIWETGITEAEEELLNMENEE
jgi:hypothetical protein